MSSSDTDLTDDIPSEASALYQAKPDIRQEYETVSASEYDNRNGDLAELIESAASNGQVVDLDSGEYDMSSVSLYDAACGVVGDGADSCTIHCETGGGYLFNFGAEDPVIEGVTFQASGDVALATVQTGNEGWFNDVVFRGQRNKYDANGERFTFLIQADSGATNLINNCRFPDGGTNHSDNDSVGHAIGPNADPGHEGLNVWRNCLAQGFMDNGFYVNNSPGRNVLWNCTARNNGAGNIRLGQNDYVVGGLSEVTDLPDDRLGKPLEADDGGNITVIGLEIYGSGDAYGNEAIQLRSNLQDITLDRVVAHVDGSRRIARLSGDNPDITLRDCYWYDEGNHNESVIYSYGSNVIANNMHVYSPNDALYFTSGSFSHNGTTYDPGTYAASDVGFDDPRPLPSFGFGDSDGGGTELPTPTGTLSVFAEDAQSGGRIDGAEVTATWLEDDPHEEDETGPHVGTTGSSTVAAGGVDFGALPIGYYQIEVTHPDYETGTYDEELWRNEGETTNEALYLDTEGRLPIIYLTPTDGGGDGGDVEQWTEETIDSDEFGEGVAVFEGLPVSPPNYDIRATHPNHQAATYNDLSLDSTGREPVITLPEQLDADTLTVTITTGDSDTPVADATVRLFDTDEN